MKAEVKGLILSLVITAAFAGVVGWLFLRLIHQVNHGG